jgi:hypothetical protein
MDFPGLSNLSRLGHSSHSFASSLGSLSHFLFFLNAWLIIKSPVFDLREKTFFGQLLLKISYGFFNLVVLNNDFHTFSLLPQVILSKGQLLSCEERKKHPPKPRDAFPCPKNMRSSRITRRISFAYLKRGQGRRYGCIPGSWRCIRQLINPEAYHWFYNDSKLRLWESPPSQPLLGIPTQGRKLIVQVSVSEYRNEEVFVNTNMTDS